MNTDTIITALLAAATALKDPATAVASEALRDLYGSMKYYLRRKLQQRSDAIRALDFAIEKPASPPRKAALIEEVEGAELDRDEELVRLATRLRDSLPQAMRENRVAVTVEGTRNQVNVAGGDLTVTSRLVRRNVITPDDRHLAREQRTRLRAAVHDLASRMARVGAPPNFAAVHAMLQRRFAVTSYLLIPRERYGEALEYLRRELVIRRGVLAHRDPARLRVELFRAIYARAGELGWSREELYRFAAERLDVPERITSLKQFGADQLRKLADRMRRFSAAVV